MALVHCLANYASVREGHSNSSSSRRRPGPIGAMGTGLRRCDGVAARSPTASLGGETPGGSPLVTPIARHYTGGKLVCSGRVAVGLHRRIALAPWPRDQRAVLGCHLDQERPNHILASRMAAIDLCVSPLLGLRFRPHPEALIQGHSRLLTSGPGDTHLIWMRLVIRPSKRIRPIVG